MDDEIRILSVELENYRQYYGKHKIVFSSRDEGFTIIAGKNGEGKSNLLNSISWCLYHEEPHGMGNRSTDLKLENKSLSVINNRYVKELKEGSIGKSIVKVQIKIGEVTYSISRVLEILKHKLEYKELDGGEKVLLIAEHASDKVPSGCEIMNEDNNDFVIKKKDKDQVDFHDTASDADPLVIMNQILPRGLSKYFLLDGDFLEGFWKNPDIIREGVGEISQLNLLDKLKTDVDKMRIPSKGISRDTDKLTTELQTLAWFKQSVDEHGNEKFSEEIRWKSHPDDEDLYYHATGEPRIKDLESDIKKMKDKTRGLMITANNINIVSLKSLQDKMKTVEEQLTEEGKILDELRKTYTFNLITKSPYIFLKEAIDKSLEIIKDRMSIGDLPVRQRRLFADDLLTRGTCICGEKLDSADESNMRRKEIEKFKNNLTGKDDLDAAVDMRFGFTHEFSDGYDTFLKLTFGDIRERFTKSVSKHSDLKKTLQGTKIKLKEYGNVEMDELLDEHAYLEEQIQIKQEDIDTIKNQIVHNGKTISTLKGQLEKALKANVKAQKLTHELMIWNDVYQHLEQVYDQLNNEIRISVQNKTWKNFQSLLANPNEFKDFKIESNYTVYLLDQHGFNKIRNLSAGQSLILTLAFVAALREPTGYRFPLVVDSPLGKIDGGNRYNIGKKLPEYLPEEQLILLVTDTEYAADLPPDPDYPDLPNTPFGKLLEKSTPLKHLKIKKEKSGVNTGNSSIKSAKLVFNDERNGWMVETDD